MKDADIWRMAHDLGPTFLMNDAEFRSFVRMCREGLIDRDQWHSSFYRDSVLVAVRDAALEGYANQPTKEQ